MRAPTRALVTGAASGIGRCFAEVLAARGCAVGLVDVAAAPLAAVAAAIAAAGGRAHHRVADVGEAAELGPAVDDLVSGLGGLDLAIHCAAIAGAGLFAAQSVTEFDRVLRVNLAGTANLVRSVAPALRGGGAVACIASTAAVHGWPALSAYSASKFGVAGFCDAVRPELARDGVHLATVFPLLIDTPLVAAGRERAPILHGRGLPPRAVVDKTLAGLAAGRARIYVPGTVRLVALLHAVAPSLLDWYGRRMGLAGAR
jgi:3-oxoacyl-[acyl-carrier protein] reductase